ncbi:hypothetical protein Dsin_005215 [Dipteronia sinensis]|uniref:Uncharacterized protein n=1 Tax=Dipteronia sinensis TaxID=43782 RepID=A0AAE0EEE5_9ROSI|nr:hypothetical protein Dsin_005215 [Dipteronia sinensis]
MALTIGNTAGGGRLHYTNPTTVPLRRRCRCHVILFPSTSTTQTQALARARTLHVASAAKKFSSKTGRFDNKNRRSNTTTTEEEKDDQQQNRTVGIGEGSVGQIEIENAVVDGFVISDLPGLQPDFWEGPQWDGFGFFLQYMWAFGIVFALIACGIAVATYNEGATDFKDTPAYKESIQSQEFLEEPDASKPDVFESNPTEVAPSLE